MTERDHEIDSAVLFALTSAAPIAFDYLGLREDAQRLTDIRLRHIDIQNAVSRLLYKQVAELTERKRVRAA